jgi:hypothetical protein
MGRDAEHAVAVTRGRAMFGMKHFQEPRLTLAVASGVERAEKASPDNGDTADF